jgi:hypothetical protein
MVLDSLMLPIIEHTKTPMKLISSGVKLYKAMEQTDYKENPIKIKT